MQPVSVILLAYNEREVIECVIRDNYDNVISKIPGSELIIAEDGSTDGTKEIIDKLKDEIPLRVVTGSGRKGYIKAFRDALTLPKLDLIFFSDASGKHKAEDYWKMLAVLEDSDVVIGYKRHRRDPLYRVVMSRIFNYLVNKYFGVHFHDINCGYRLMKKKAVQTILNDEWLFKDLINTELTLRMVAHRFKVNEVQVQHQPRAAGPSRGLPISIIPRAIYRTLKRFPILKREMKSMGGANQ